MSRALRVELPGATYHVTARGNARAPIYFDDEDRQAFLRILAHVRRRFDWRCWAFCLLDNHYHLLLRTPQPNLARGMRQLNSVYAQSFNRRHERVGHLFQGRYASVLVQRDEHLFAALRYVAMNPVVAGLCARPEEWAWSSHRAVAGLQHAGIVAVDEVLAFVADDPAVARSHYRALVATDDAAYTDGDGVVVGESAFVRATLTDIPAPGESPRRHWTDGRAPLAEVLRATDREGGATSAYLEHGYTMAEIARELGVHYSTVSRWLKLAGQ